CINTLSDWASEKPSFATIFLDFDTIADDLCGCTSLATASRERRAPPAMKKPRPRSKSWTTLLTAIVTSYYRASRHENDPRQDQPRAGSRAIATTSQGL